ncbi:MAG: helix-turn-helix domain-containing protein [Chthoniobacter sp.]
MRPRLQYPRRRRQEIAALKRERSAWLEALAAEAPFQALFDQLPGVCFFAKDRTGRTMFASQGILQRYQMRHEQEMLGLTDHDINPGPMADHYVQDDERLLSGTVKRIERLELWFDGQGLPDWFIVTKLAIPGKRGRPQGVMGVLRRAEEHERELPSFQTVSRAVERMRRDYAQSLLIADIAQACGQSVRQLQRHFQKAFGVTPQEFLIKTRVIAATQMLEGTNLTAAEIAGRCGFADASSFSQQFKQQTGVTPLAYRDPGRGRSSSRDGR